MFRLDIQRVVLLVIRIVQLPTPIFGCVKSSASDQCPVTFLRLQAAHIVFHQSRETVNACSYSNVAVFLSCPHGALCHPESRWCHRSDHRQPSGANKRDTYRHTRRGEQRDLVAPRTHTRANTHIIRHTVQGARQVESSVCRSLGINLCESLEDAPNDTAHHNAFVSFMRDGACWLGVSPLPFN